MLVFLRKEDIKMDKNQKINCSVGSCVYQDEETKRCTLQAIHVMPTQDCKTKKTDESMCGSYECKE